MNEKKQLKIGIDLLFVKPKKMNKRDRKIILKMLGSLTKSKITINLEETSDEIYKRIIQQCKFVVLPWTKERSNRVSGQLFDFIEEEVPVILPRYLALNGLGLKKVVPGVLTYDDNSEISFEKVIDNAISMCRE